MKFNMKKIENNKYIQKLIKFANSNFITKIILSLLIWIVALLPVWMYIGVRWAIEPSGFWEEFAIFITFAIVIGWIQFILIVLGIGLR